ncbi:MAG: FtsX-like permease family protein [Actinomycetaceae bacterium]
MLRLAASQARHSAGRLAAAGLAIVLAAAFLALALLTGRVVEEGARTVLRSTLAGADLVLQYTAADEDLLAEIRAIDGVDSAVPGFDDFVQVRAGDAITHAQLAAAPADGSSELMELIDGRPPEGQGEVVLTEVVARSLGADVGDGLTVALPPDGAGSTDGSDQTEVTVVGIAAEPPSIYGSSSVLVLAPEPLALELAGLDGAAGASAVSVTVADDAFRDAVADEVLAAALAAAPDPGTTVPGVAPPADPSLSGRQTSVVTADDYVDARLESELGSDRILTIGAGFFAGLSMVVAGLVIANTFQVLVAQRTRTLAMLRAVGATRRQVFSSVVLEAAALGVVGSAVGVVVGYGVLLGALRIWAAAGTDLGIPLPTSVPLTIFSVGLTLVVGTLVTVVAALAPARRASAVAPVAAMRPAQPPTVLHGSNRRRAVASLLAVLGLGTMTGALVIARSLDPEGASVDEQAMVLTLGLLVLGAALLGLGLLLGLVFLVPAAARGLGGVLAALVPRRARATARLATANATHNPHRTAATTMALVIGITLVTGVTTGTASIRASIEQGLASRFPVDVAVHDPSFAASGEARTLSPAIIDAVEGVEGLAATTAVTEVQVSIERVPSDTGAQGPVTTGFGTMAYGLDDDAAEVARSGTIPGLGAGTVVLPSRMAGDLGVADGDTVLVGPTDPETWAMDEESAREMTVAVAEGGDLPLLTLGDALAFVPGTEPTDVWARADGSVPPGEVVRSVRDAAEGAAPDGSAPYVEGTLAERETYDSALDAIVLIVVGLLAVSVAIALVGVANTLSLSVIERRREIATLRAVGMTRRQVRGSLAVEGVLLAVVGTAVGMAFGLALGWAGTYCLLALSGLTEIAVPWAGLGLTLVIALVAGVVASILPARSALRVTPVEALGAE